MLDLDAIPYGVSTEDAKDQHAKNQHVQLLQTYCEEWYNRVLSGRELVKAA